MLTAGRHLFVGSGLGQVNVASAVLEPAPRADEVFTSFLARVFGGGGQAFGEHLLFLSEIAPTFAAAGAAAWASVVIHHFVYNRIISETFSVARKYSFFDEENQLFARLAA